MEKTIKLDYMTSRIFVLLFWFYLLAILTSMFLDSIPLNLVGKYALIFFVLLLNFLLLAKKTHNKKEIMLLAPYFAFTFVYFLNADSLMDRDIVFLITNQLSYIMLIYLIVSISWGNKQIKSLSHLFTIGYPLLFLLIFVTTDLMNRNTIGSYTYFLMFFPLLYLFGYSKNFKKTQIILIVTLTFAVVLATDSRSVLLSAVFGLLTLFAWRLISKKKIFFYLYFLAIATFNYLFTVVYPKMYTWNSYHKIEELSLKFTEKPVLTGREKLWERIMDLILQQPWLGYGSTVVPEDFFKTNFSSHNLYLEIGLQTGFVGIALLLLFMFLIWKSFWNNKKDKRVILASCYFIGIMVHQVFEVTLTHNQYGIGLLQWTIIAFGLNFSLNKNEIKTELK